jgi:ribosomal protein L20
MQTLYQNRLTNYHGTRKRRSHQQSARRNVLKMVKGYRFGRSRRSVQAREAIFHAGKYAFAHRRDKKNDFRRLWNVRINAGLDTMDHASSSRTLAHRRTQEEQHHAQPQDAPSMAEKLPRPSPASKEGNLIKPNPRALAGGF